MKKSVILLLTVLVLAVCVPTAAKADIIVELNDDFWRAHNEECVNVHRTYTANGQEGYVILWRSPKHAEEWETVRNGEKLSGNWQYTDENGELWMAVNGGYKNGEEVPRGWVKTSECVVEPDYITFRESHGGEFTTYDNTHDDAFNGLETVVLWSYPCSGKIYDKDIDAEWFRSNQSFNDCWRDGEGRLWAYVDYCYGRCNAWLCLDDPTNAEIPVDTSLVQEGPELIPPIQELPAPKSSVTGVVIGLVAGVTVVTAVVLWVVFARKRKGGEQN